MHRYNKIITLGTILLLIPMSSTSAQVISVSNLNIGDTFRFSYSKVSVQGMVNGTEYPMDFNVDLVDQCFNITVVGGYYEPSTLSNTDGTDMEIITFRPYNAGIIHNTTYDNETLNNEEVFNVTSSLDEWLNIYFGYVYNLAYVFEYFSPSQLIGDFDVPYQQTIDLEPAEPIVSYFVNNNESFYQQYLADTDGPIIELNSTTTEDGTDIRTFDEYVKYENHIDLDDDVLQASLELNFTVYGNIGDTEWSYGFYSLMDFDIDYGRGIITSYDIEIQMSQAYDDAFSSSITRVASQEYVPPIETTTSTTDESIIDTVETEDTTLDLDLNYPTYSLISFCLVGVMVRYLRSR